MARSFKTSFALLGLTLGLGPLQATGQTVPSSYSFFETRQEAGAFFGVTNQGTGRFGYSPKPGNTFGVRYAIHLAGPFGLEGALSYLPTTRDIIDPSRSEGDRIVGETEAKILRGDARLRFSLTGDRTWKGFHPFLLVGAGLGWDVAPETTADELLLPDDRFQFGTRFTTLFGVGARWLLTDRILVRGDMVVDMYRIKTPRGFQDPERALTGVGEKEWVSGPTVSFGLAYHF